MQSDLSCSVTNYNLYPIFNCLGFFFAIEIWFARISMNIPLSKSQVQYFMICFSQAHHQASFYLEYTYHFFPLNDTIKSPSPLSETTIGMVAYQVKE